MQRWRIFNRRIGLMSENVDLIIMDCVVLHNYPKEQHDLTALYYTLNPDNIPCLRVDGAILAVPNFHGYHTPAQAKESGISIPFTLIIQKGHCLGSTEQLYTNDTNRKDIPKDFGNLLVIGLYPMSIL